MLHTIFNKGVHSVYSNYQGITLLGLSRKAYARVLESRLRLTEPHIQEERCGFRPCRGTVNQIFTSSRICLFCRPGEGLGTNYCPHLHSRKGPHDGCRPRCTICTAVWYPRNYFHIARAYNLCPMAMFSADAESSVSFM